MERPLCKICDHRHYPSEPHVWKAERVEVIPVPTVGGGYSKSGGLESVSTSSAVGVAPGDVSAIFDRRAYQREYMRGYMRRRRQKEK